MDAAVATLRTRAIPRLFTLQLKTSSGRDVAQQKEREGVCDCQEPTLPDDWKLLRRFPVLKRFVLKEWQRQDEEFRRQKETQSKRRRVSNVGLNSIRSTPIEGHSAQSLITLCCYLCQCGLLGTQDLELAHSVVDMSFPIVLCKVVIASAVPLDTRMLLLAVAIQYQCAPRIKETATEEWLQFVCDKLQQEMADRMVSMSRDSQSTPKRGRKSAHTSESLVWSQRVNCEYCLQNGQEDSRNANAALESSGYDALLDAVRCIIVAVNGETNRRGSKLVASSLKSLQNLVLTPEVRSWFRPADGNKKSINRWHELFEVNMDPGSKGEARLTLSAYSKLCEKVVSSKNTQKTTCMWVNVWRRERARFANKKSILFEDIILHCSMADQFATCTVMEKNDQDLSSTLGFQLVAEVIATISLSYVQTLSAFAHVWVILSKSAKSPTTGSASICKSYLYALLQHPNRVWSIVTDRSNSVEVSGKSVLQLMHSTWIVFGRNTQLAGESTADARMNRIWDLVLIQVHEYCWTQSGTNPGMNWLLALQLCAAQLMEATNRYSPYFMTSIKIYFEKVILLLVSSNGAFISSGEIAEHKLVSINADLTQAQSLIALIMECLDHRRICNLIACILRERSICAWRASRMETDLVLQNGMINFLVPGIVAWIHRVVSSGHYTGEIKQVAYDMLIGLLHGVHDQLRRVGSSSSYIPSLICLCCTWDAYYNRLATAAISRQPIFGIDSGRYALLQLDVLPKIVKIYSNRSVIKQENRDIQTFIADLIDHAENVPTSIHDSIQQLRSQLRNEIEHSTGSDDCDEPVLISHSDEDLRDILEIFTLKDLSKVRHAANRIKHSEDGQLDGLAQNVKRWVLLLETKDPRVELGKETKLELALHCNKLIYWFPEEFAEIQIMQTPLDKQLILALAEFVKDIRTKSEGMSQNVRLPSNNIVSVSAPSAIRLELQLRSFLSSSVVPDLSALSACVMNAILESETDESFQALQKWVQNNMKYIMIEIVIDKLRAVFRLDSSIDAPIAKIEPNQELTSLDNAQIVKNAMNLMTSADTVFHPYILEWNCSIFDEISAEKWLLHLYNAKFAPLENHDGRVNDLISCLEKIVGSSQCSLKMAHSYWLAAMLCTFLFHSQSVFACITAVEEQLEKILAHMWQMLSFESDTQTDAHGNSEGDAVTIWVVHLQSRGMKSELTCVQVFHDQLQGLSSSVLESISTVADRLRDVGKRVQHTVAIERAVLPRRLILTFSTWLPTAISHSQLHANGLSPNARVGVEWETCFVDQVVNLYLPLEFEQCVSDLLTEWICIWISIDIVCAIKETRRLRLLPFQRSLCLRLSNQYWHQSDQNHEPVWSSGFQCLHRLLEQCESSMGAIATTQMIDVFMDAVVAFDLMTIATASISAQDKQIAAMALLQEFDQLVSYEHTSAWSSSQLFHWLQYPLELLVYCHIYFNQDGDPQVLKAIMVHLRTKRFLNTEQSHHSDVFETWEQNMLLRYAYLSGERCREAILAIGEEFKFRKHDDQTAANNLF